MEPNIEHGTSNIEPQRDLRSRLDVRCWTLGADVRKRRTTSFWATPNLKVVLQTGKLKLELQRQAKARTAAQATAWTPVSSAPAPPVPFRTTAARRSPAGRRAGSCEA